MAAVRDPVGLAGCSSDTAIDLTLDDEVQHVQMQAPVASESANVKQDKQEVRIHQTQAVTRAQTATRIERSQTRFTTHVKTSVVPSPGACPTTHAEVSIHQTRAVTRAQTATRIERSQARFTTRAKTNVNPSSGACPTTHAEVSKTATRGGVFDPTSRPLLPGLTLAQYTRKRSDGNDKAVASTTSFRQLTLEEVPGRSKRVINNPERQVYGKNVAHAWTIYTQAKAPKLSDMNQISGSLLHKSRDQDSKSASASLPQQVLFGQETDMERQQDASSFAEISGVISWNALHTRFLYTHRGPGSRSTATSSASQQVLVAQETVARKEGDLATPTAQHVEVNLLPDLLRRDMDQGHGAVAPPAVVRQLTIQQEDNARYGQVTLRSALETSVSGSGVHLLPDTVRTQEATVPISHQDRLERRAKNRTLTVIKKNSKKKGKKTLGLGSQELTDKAKKKADKKKRRKDRKKLEEDLLVIPSSHKNLTFWKKQAAKELQIGPELELISAAVALFDKRMIQTVVPNRYFRQNTSLKKDHQRTSTFPGNVEMLLDSPITAVKNAYKEHTVDRLDTSRLVFWTDGSVSGGRHQGTRGFAVTWRHSTTTGWGRWEAVGFKAQGELLDSNGMETLAVMKAITVACDLARKMSGQLKAVAIYTDSTGALHRAQNPKHPLGRHIIRKARMLLSSGSTISLHWCPSHSGVPGNELADKIAGMARSHVYGNMAEVVDLSDDEDDGWEGV